MSSQSSARRSNRWTRMVRAVISARLTVVNGRILATVVIRPLAAGT